MSRALVLEVMLDVNAAKTPEDVAKALREVADHLDGFTDVNEGGELREGASHMLWATETHRGEEVYTGDTKGVWTVAQ